MNFDRAKSIVSNVVSRIEKRNMKQAKQRKRTYQEPFSKKAVHNMNLKEFNKYWDLLVLDLQRVFNLSKKSYLKKYNRQNPEDDVTVAGESLKESQNRKESK